jgi:plastocyanin
VNRRLALVVALAAVLLLPGTAWATDATVTVSGSTNAFASGSPTIGLGGVVQWQAINTTRLHSTTADKFSMWTYDMPTPNSTSPGVTFDRAGGFAYHCRFHGNMRGTVMVQMMASDTTPNVNQLITITFATSGAPSGFTEQIQKRKAGGTWKTYANSTGTSVNWTPPKAKTFQFRARYKQISTGAYTGWSPILSLTVSP